MENQPNLIVPKPKLTLPFIALGLCISPVLILVFMLSQTGSRREIPSC